MATGQVVGANTRVVIAVAVSYKDTIGRRRARTAARESFGVDAQIMVGSDAVMR